MRKRIGIDINCDMGESYGRYKLGLDEEVIKLISSANVGCGFHGGDPHVMRKTVAMSKERSVGVGAHPGLPDLMGFGRRELEVTPEELADYFIYQIGALKAFVEVQGGRLQHVKMHGALMAMALADEKLTVAMCKATKELDANLIWVTHSGLRTAEVAKDMGLRVIEEFYADRAYNSDKTLVSRKLEGSVIKDAAQIQNRLRQLIQTGTVTSIEGKSFVLECDSICVHGDTPGALEMISKIRGVLAEYSIPLKRMAEIFCEKTR